MLRYHVYMRRIRWGDKRLPERFWTKTIVNEGTGCWEWTAGLDRDGYPIFRPSGQSTKRAHRHAFVALVGPIDEETLNHDCRVRHCVNPNKGHAATPMSSADNVREGKSRITHCPQGHEYTARNIIMTGPAKRSRSCRACCNARSQAYWHTTRKVAEKEARRVAGYRGGVSETATCRQGHPRTDANTYTMPNGYKTCRICRLQRTTEYNARKKSELTP